MRANQCIAIESFLARLLARSRWLHFPACARNRSSKSRRLRSNSKRRLRRSRRNSPEKLFQNVQLVNVLFTVINHGQKFVTDLDKADFKVTEDNQSQNILFFSRQTDLPLRVALLLDTSNSIRPRLKFEQDAAIDFLYNVMRKDRDQAS